jgi:outer membrane protein assembly factor BamB
MFHVDIRRTIGTAAVWEGLVYISDFSGFLHAIDAKTGQEYWKQDLLSAVWASPMVIDGRIYIGDEDGDIYILQAGKVLKVLGKINMRRGVTSTVVPAHGTLFVMTMTNLYALATAAAAH